MFTNLINILKRLKNGFSLSNLNICHVWRYKNSNKYDQNAVKWEYDETASW